MLFNIKCDVSEVFEPFLKKYLEHFKFKTVNTKDWKHFLKEYFHDKVEENIQLSRSTHL